MLHLNFTRARLEKVRTFWAKQFAVLAFAGAGAVLTGAVFSYHWYLAMAAVLVWAAFEALATFVLLAGHDPPE